jgi:hypothetical protein
MSDVTSSVLAPWSNFYVIVGSSAAGLTGLMFVVITLIAGMDREQRTPEGIGAFGTPTVMHFCIALLISAALAAPWNSLVPPATLVGLSGLFGMLHVLRAARKAVRQTAYQTVGEDWVWYSVLPLASYVTIAVAAFAVPSAPAGALFALAGGVLLLIFIGIRNAWDIVTWLAVGQYYENPAASDDEAPASS